MSFPGFAGSVKTIRGAESDAQSCWLGTARNHHLSPGSHKPGVPPQPQTMRDGLARTAMPVGNVLLALVFFCFSFCRSYL